MCAATTSERERASMSFQCTKCSGLRLEPQDGNSGWGYGGKWCTCEIPGRAAPGCYPVGHLTEADVRRIVREVLDEWAPTLKRLQEGKP